MDALRGGLLGLAVILAGAAGCRGMGRDTRGRDLAAAAQSLGLSHVAEPDSAHQPEVSSLGAVRSTGTARNVIEGTIGGVRVRAFDWQYDVQHVLTDLERVSKPNRLVFTKRSRARWARTEERGAATMLYVFPGIVGQGPWFHFEARAKPDSGPPTLERLYVNIVAADSAALFTPETVAYLIAHPGWTVQARGADLTVCREGQRCAPASLRACLEEAVALARVLTRKESAPVGSVP